MVAFPLAINNTGIHIFEIKLSVKVIVILDHFATWPHDPIISNPKHNLKKLYPNWFGDDIRIP